MISKKVLKDYSICAIKTCLGYIIAKFFKKNEIWLISERGTDARDNGYFFYKYLCKNHPDINCYYVIDYKSPDYKNVEKSGKTIRYGSMKHYIYLFLAQYLISSHIMGYTPCPGFFIALDKRKKIFKGKRIFLQHGITKDNIEGLKYPNVKVDTFICGALPEYEYIKENYNYPSGVVQYTGLARYDNLVDYNVKKQILIMPTWRKWLNSCSESDFKDSFYYQKWNSILRNKALNEKLEKESINLVFYPHYEMQKFLHLFEQNKNIKLASFEKYDVPTLLKESTVLLTDYSSVYFDFAYMNKPIIFFQFDKEEFFKGHYQRGYIDETEFGKVTDKTDEAIEILFDIINGFYDDTLYKENNKKYFKYRDKNNCDRIYKKIVGDGRDI